MPTPVDRSTLLAILRSRQPLASALAGHGVAADAYQAALAELLRSKVPQLDGRQPAGIHGPARILRDRHGVAHITADDPDDLFFAYGYATAQDRLWQMDFLRRAAQGRLAEILGQEALAGDIEARTVGIGRLAAQLEAELPEETAQILAAFTEGINAVVDAFGDNLPIEFDILDYQCDPWSIADSLTLMKHFWWQLTGRLFLITGPELLQRNIGSGPPWEAFLRSEVHGESILPPGENRGAPLGRAGEGRDVGGRVGIDLDAGPPGSNNWVLSPGRSATGHALFASDPHTPYLAPTVWHEVHLHGAGYDAAGMGYVGIPGIVFGRNRKGAWGITNNICSLRDLFVYPADDWSKSWRKEGLTERIAVRNGAEFVLNLLSTDLGPIVNHLLPAGLMGGPDVALRWVGSEVSDEIGCLLRLNRASSAEDFRSALSDWVCPTFNFVWADASGNIAYQCAGRLPRRNVPGRGLRPADDPEQHWAGSIPFECNPWCVNPRQGWIGTANNPILPTGEDPGLGGMWTSDARARRIRDKMEGQRQFTLEECAAFQLDTTSTRVPAVIPSLVDLLASSAEPPIKQAAELLRTWNGDLGVDSAAAAVFEAFTRHWGNLVLTERQLPDDVRDLLTRHIFGVMFQLVKADDIGWFSQGNRKECILEAMRLALDDLTARLGPDMASWRWGELHTLTLRHPLGKREPLGALFNTGPRPVGGAGHTVNNQWLNSSGSYESVAGANCRVAADLGTAELLVTNCLGQSGHPGSPHYRDQLDDWLAGRLHVISLDWPQVEKEAKHRLELIAE